MELFKVLQNEFQIREDYAKNLITLLDEGNTIPFIARYRKEMHGTLDDQIIREFSLRLIYLRNLEERKIQVRNSIEEQGKLTEEISIALDKAITLVEVEDIYRPYKQKKKTKASVARKKGLEPLALLILEQTFKGNILEEAKKYIKVDGEEELQVKSVEEAITGAKHIIAEIISDNPNFRKDIRNITFEKGVISSKGDDTENTTYQNYYSYQERIKTIADHRILAINRGENEKILKVKLVIEEQEIYNYLKSKIIKQNTIIDLKDLLSETIVDSYDRLIASSIESEIRNEVTERAEDAAIHLFAKNLIQLLMQSPLKGKVIMGFDPGYRTGCKLAVIDATGTVLDTGVVNVTLPGIDLEPAKKKFLNLIKKHNVEVIAIGNGTASRESEKFVSDFLKEYNINLQYVIVSEAGASVYSASKIGAEEFPDFDVSLRSAISIGRRLMDPLAELVKIEPKSIGVGQYQHDLNQKNLSESLRGVVEDCVNTVGVDLNTASLHLLQYISGINSGIAKNIVEYREKKKKIKNRQELLSINKIGQKAFEQCAGFLRISDGEEILDNTEVHPESYEVARKLIQKLNINVEDLKTTAKRDFASKITDEVSLAKELNIGLPTLRDIISALEKPGRDIRENAESIVFKSEVISIEDLKQGMVLKGIVRNIIDFGAFVDIGVHQDGLVHISQLANKFVKHPLDIVKIGDVVTVKILEVDVNKKRISLSMKEVSHS